ncbi:hypothetical protein PF007_g25344 [Phytophthora fragariae]|uniref:Uncharacterized protein n=1 Tax=Phytophthora fragariae TaxID=53985 RepID=A0A6A3QEF6_9STRA|nr:hypothetical protein PF007_g25344 [Phytophthora fragariae]
MQNHASGPSSSATTRKAAWLSTESTRSTRRSRVPWWRCSRTARPVWTCTSSRSCRRLHVLLQPPSSVLLRTHRFL